MKFASGGWGEGLGEAGQEMELFSVRRLLQFFLYIQCISCVRNIFRCLRTCECVFLTGMDHTLAIFVFLGLPY